MATIATANSKEAAASEVENPKVRKATASKVASEVENPKVRKATASNLRSEEKSESAEKPPQRSRERGEIRK